MLVCFVNAIVIPSPSVLIHGCRQAHEWWAQGTGLTFTATAWPRARLDA
jgi:hypothetical protein